jgi:hypothetical protein
VEVYIDEFLRGGDLACFFTSASFSEEVISMVAAPAAVRR